VPSISSPSSLALSYRRADIAGFWALAALLATLLSGLAATALSVRMPWAWGLGSAACLIVPGRFCSGWFEIGIWAWNGSVRRVASLLRTYVLYVCYYLLFAPIGIAGSALDFSSRPDSRSGWIPTGEAPLPLMNTPADGSDSAHWYRALHACARSTGNGWRLCLLPVVCLLILLRDEGQDSPQLSSTYTLY
jgi:hypothetical protein